jgi:hypothetical protein
VGEIGGKKEKDFTQKTQRPTIGCFPASKLMFACRGADFALTMLSRRPRLILVVDGFLKKEGPSPCIVSA